MPVNPPGPRPNEAPVVAGSSDPLRTGRRVVVRHRLPEGSQPSLTDVIGVVSSLDEAAVTVQTRRGPVTVQRVDVVAVKAVPPAPVRRGRPHTAIGTTDLERLMADGWRAVEEEWLGDWMLRASSGFTTRGNSVLPLGEPGTELAKAIRRVEGWYAERGLPPRFQLAQPSGSAAVRDDLDAELSGRGYSQAQPSLVLTGASGDIEPLTDGSAPVHVDASLRESWLQTYARQRSIVPGVTEHILTGSPGQLFASTTGRSGSVTAIARMSIHPGWAGIQTLWVDPDHRGRGLGRTLVHAIGMLARKHRVASVYLQVEADNVAAIALYESEGFRIHHRYAYLVRSPLTG